MFSWVFSWYEENLWHVYIFVFSVYILYTLNVFWHLLYAIVKGGTDFVLCLSLSTVANLTTCTYIIIWSVPLRHKRMLLLSIYHFNYLSVTSASRCFFTFTGSWLQFKYLYAVHFYVNHSIYCLVHSISLESIFTSGF